MTIVLLDDNPEIFDVYRLLLRDLVPDAKIRTFTHGLNAWNCLTATDVDLLITDLNHPAPDGLQIMDRLAEAKRNVPVLVVSSMPLRKQVESLSTPERPVIFLALPFAVPEFNRTILELIGVRNAS